MRGIPLLLLLFVGCGSMPTAPTGSTPNEEFVIERAAHYASQLGIVVEVVFRDTGVAASTGAAGLKVYFLRSFVESTDHASLSFTVAHEVCHASGIGDEGKASDCARRLT